MEKKVVAEVILRSEDGSSILDAGGAITAANIDKYRVGKEVIDEVSGQLEALGLNVEQVGPTSLTISGDREIFERVFQTSLEIRGEEVLGTEAVSAQTKYYQASRPIVVPEALSSLIADVVLPTPPVFFP